jgi:DNA repair protein RadC
MLRYGTHSQEHLGAVYLDSRHRVLAERVIFVGTVNSALVSTRDVLKVALDLSAAAIIAFHNHPSGDPSPSAEDLVFTRKLVEAGKVLSVDVLDHLILSAARYTSLAHRGAI